MYMCTLKPGDAVVCIPLKSRTLSGLNYRMSMQYGLVLPFVGKSGIVLEIQPHKREKNDNFHSHKRWDAIVQIDGQIYTIFEQNLAVIAKSK